MISKKSTEIAELVVEIFQQQSSPLINPLLYTNVAEAADEAFQSWVFNYNVPRLIGYASVGLLRYERGTIVDGDDSYVTYSGGYLVSEQLPNWTSPSTELVNSILLRTYNGPSVKDQCLLIARYGDTTWGHWLFELLSKIVIAEAFFPNRFRYVVPSRIFTSSPTVSPDYVAAIVGSLKAYGISEDRLIALPSRGAVRFDNLFDITGTNTCGMHPQVMALMQAKVQPSNRRYLPKRAAILRRASEARSLSNHVVIIDFLARRGYDIIDIASQPFDFQVALFAEAQSLVVALGSGFAASLYMRNKADVVSIGPSMWYDNYFAITLSQKEAFYADIRGSVLSELSGGMVRAQFDVNLSAVGVALDVLTARSTLDSPSGTVLIGGRPQPRCLGRVVFELEFGKKGSAEPFQREGWCEAEEERTWTFGSRSSLTLPVTADVDCWLEIKGAVFVCPPLYPVKEITPTVNSVALPGRKVSEHCHLFWRVPKEALRNFPLMIQFDHPDCPSPQSLGVSSDNRELGVSFFRLAIYECAEA